MKVCKLKTRNRPVPGGCAFFDSATNFKAGQFDDFETQCRGVQSARLGNPGLTKRYRKSTDMESIRDEVDIFWATYAKDHGYSDFYLQVEAPSGGAPEQAPFTNPNRSVRSRVAAAAAGVRTIYEWIRSKEEAVPAELANARAARCVACPLNEQGNLADYFQTAAAAAIKSELEQRKEWDLTTPDDAKLGVCQGCFCVNSLSVHSPIEIKLKHLPKDAFDALHPDCWVRSEKKKLE